MLLGMVVASANAQESVSREPDTATPLTLEEVLSASAKFYPAILEAQANRREALGEITEAAGGFDTLVQAESSSYASGFYDGQAAKGTITQPLRAFGTNIYGEYKVSEGDFPIYEDINFVRKFFSLKTNRSLPAAKALWPAHRRASCWRPTSCPSI